MSAPRGGDVDVRLLGFHGGDRSAGPAREPHSWDLCVGHAGRITAPRGWELVRHPGPLPNPDEDDLVALADAVREGRGGWQIGPRSTASVILAARLRGTGQRREYRRAGFHRPPIQRKRTPSGHLRVLPDPRPSAGVAGDERAGVPTARPTRMVRLATKSPFVRSPVMSRPPRLSTV
ncbi:hypothetical protein I553_4026 [Mycobacterium xenopi 4042]|uniref:DUF3499 domain-containing protein n=1 Tax=Mycobacterium xenopi 4042 TaxID=1299334 RepID=X8DEZ5_MYCXE|nr:hypothetical protein I553_4026 [Mycobacterium xenopi 4042]